MFGSDILEVAIGLVFVYLLTSLIATAAREALEGWLKDRGRSLEQGLIELFGHDVTNPALPVQPAADAGEAAIMLARQSLLERFYKHPLIFSLFRGDYHPPEKRAAGTEAEKSTEGKLPSYIPSANFADAILEVAESYLRPGSGGAPLSFDRLVAAAWAVPNPPVRRMLLLALNTSKGDLDQARRYLQNWYDGAMDRVSGWYRRKTQIIVFSMGLVLCTLLNVNTVVIAHALHEDVQLRAAIGHAASKWIDEHPTVPAVPPPAGDDGASTALPARRSTILADTEDRLRVPYTQMQALGLPVGWGGPVRALMWQRLHPDGADGGLDWLGVPELLVGWLMTALAIMLGAPFWFDVLNTIMVVRSTVKPTEKSPDESSKDLKSTADAAGGKTQSAPPAPGVAGQAAPPPPVLSPADAGAREIAMLDPAQRPREEEMA